MLKIKNILYALLLILICQVISAAQSKSVKGKWMSLFDGRDLAGWDIKIAGAKLNDNYKNTFRVEQGILRVSYDEYKTFNGEYGHIYYHTPFSYYLLHVEYRFVGDQCKGGEAWNVRNSGVMIHSQSAGSMGLQQNFPVSLEIQFLGGLGKGKRTTANLCTPGTVVELDGKIITDHILESSSQTYDGDQWVTVDAIVLSDSVIRHFVNGEEVLSYTKPQIGGGFVGGANDWEWGKVKNADEWKRKQGTPLQGGYIALQAESHPIEFRKVELLNLEGLPGWRKLDLHSFFPKP